MVGIPGHCPRYESHGHPGCPFSCINPHALDGGLAGATAHFHRTGCPAKSVCVYGLFNSHSNLHRLKSVMTCTCKLGCRKWGCNKWGLKGCLTALPGNRPKSAFFALFRRVRRAPGKSRKRRKKAFFLRYPQICLNPHLLNPHLRHPK